jgi:putative cell wall-binding protein
MKKAVGLAVIAVLLATGVAPTTAAAAVVAITRISGIDRYQVAANVSQSFKSSGLVFIASGQVFPDALSGGPAAGLNGATLLLVNANAVPAATQSELDRLKPTSIVVLGGSGSVSDAS